MKTCAKCKREQAESEFCKDKRSKDGLRSWCKSCKREALNEWRDKNREHVRELDRKYYAADPEKQRAEARTAYQNDPERAKARNKAWYAAHPDYKQERYKQQVEKERARQREYGRKHPEKTKAKLEKWKAKNPGKQSQYTIKKRNYKSDGMFTADEWNAMLDRYGHQCLACHATDKRLVSDHVIPLARGGSNTIDNIQPLCEQCNNRKKARTIDYRPR